QRTSRISEMKQSGDLARVLRKLRISTFGRLAGTSLRDLQRVSDTGTALFVEIEGLIQRARHGDFAAPPAQHVRLKRTSSLSGVVGAPKRTENADRRVENRPISEDVI